MRNRQAAVLLALAVAIGGCDDKQQPPPRTRPSEDGVLPGWEKPLLKQTSDAIKRASAAATKLRSAAAAGAGADGASGSGRVHYLELRRNVAAAAPFFRMRAELGSEVLLGPLRSVDEGGGALAALDRALADGDEAMRDRQLEQVMRALRLIDNELALRGVPADASLQALSDACYEIGLILLEAYPGVPDQPDAVLADLRGTLDAVVAGTKTLAAMVPPKDEERTARALTSVTARLAPLEEAARRAEHAHELSGRAELVRASGLLGVAVRRFARELGVRVKLPYEARRPVAGNRIDEPITPFVLPARRKSTHKHDAEAAADLGKQLFFERRLSRGAARACADCHQPAKAFTDGLAVPPTLDPGEPIRRNTPTLLYSPLHAAQLHDGQFASAESQALKVIHSFAEMGLTSEDLTRVIEGVPAYKEQLDAIFEDGVTAQNVARALVAFEIRDLVPGSAPIDRFARGELSALDAELSRGLDIFAGVGRCARCHIPPLFGGSRPSDFAVPVYAVLGVPSAPDKSELDADRGRGAVSRRPLDEHAFKTPTVRNVDRTAPYFHHGAFATLEQVVDFYDKGGGKGAGIELPNQDPDVRPLKLEPDSKRALLAFMRQALSDEQLPLTEAPSSAAAPAPRPR